ncbi:MAG TPA: histidine phosphatase family protein [Chloroflexia bacterium]|nr:histidine phosphatase family protein [Chloroflexia bacterium]
MSPPSTTILLVRHADVHNPADVVYGRLPRFGLSRTGYAEAARTAAALAATPLAALYTSPQLRARQTARTLAAPHPGLAVRVTRLLAEVRTGYQGLPNVEMARRLYNFYEPPHHPDDEGLADVAARIVRWLARVLAAHPGQVVAGVSHGDPLMIVRLLFDGQDVTLTTMRNPALYPTKGSITRLVFQGRGDPRRLPVAVTYDDPNQAHRAAPPEADTTAPWAARSAASE